MVSFLRGGFRLCASVGLLASGACSLSLGLDTLDSDPAGGAAGSVMGLAGQTAAGGTDPLGQGGAPSAGQGGTANGGAISAAGFPGAGGTGGVAGKGAGGGAGGGGSAGKSVGGSGGKSTGGGGAGKGGSSTGGQGGSGGAPAGGNGGSAGAPKGAVTLAADQKTPVGIGLDDLHVYWVNVAPAAIYRVLKTGGNPEPLVTSVDLDDPRDVVVNGSTLYWSEWTPNLIRQRALSGGAAQTFVTGAGRVGALAVNSGIFYATDDRTDQPSQGTVIVVPAGAMGSQVLFSIEPLATGMGVAGNDLAWASSGSIKLGTTSGGPSVTLVGQPSNVKVSGVALDDARVYWVEDDMRIRSADRASGKVSPFYDPTGPLGRGDVAVDAGFVYWTEPDTGLIRRQAK